MTRVQVLCAMRMEALAVRLGAPRVAIKVSGIGPAKASSLGRRLASELPQDLPCCVVGLAGGLLSRLRPGTMVVASELKRKGREPIRLPGAEIVAGAIRRLGLEAEVGPVISVDHIVHGEERDQLAAEGAVAVDMESAWFAEALAPRPLLVIRSISDTVGTGVFGVARGVALGLGSLRRGAPVGLEWARAWRPREIILASPRSFCAGVERAIEVVERAIERYGAPVYVRRQIVHNHHVVSRLEQMGAIFVEELDQVPDGAVVVFSAHGVSPKVREEATRRQLQTIDATCPLVAKVHLETRRFASRGYQVILIGHAGHDEVEGTLGEAPGAILVSRPEDVEALDLPRDTQVAYTNQTTLAPEDVAQVVDAIRRRFPSARGPAADDICYATHNRQEALRAILPQCDTVIVASSPNSSNGNRLAEIAARGGVRVALVDDASQLDLGWLAGASKIGITAAASTPEWIVEEVLEALSGLGPIQVRETSSGFENVRFPLPQEVR
jgi:4-hydroxy-3-methylbut-2-enyl diphosphate reductase